MCTVIAMLAACSSATDGAVSESTGDVAMFCSGWTNTRLALQEDFDRPDPNAVRGLVVNIQRILKDVELVVPVDLRDDWQAASRYQRTVLTLIEVSDYQPERLRKELIDAAFGEQTGEEVAEASEAALARIDEWSAAECGSFCELWPRLDRALALDERGDFYQLIFEGEAQEALILLADELVPDAVRADWDEAAGFKLRLVEFARSWDWQVPWHEFDEQEGNRLMEELYAFESVLESYFADDVGARQMHPAELAARYVADRRDSIGEWVRDNCESVGVSGLPGVVEVTFETVTSGTLFVGVLPPGGDPGGVEDASGFLGVACSEQQHSWEQGPFRMMILERERGFEEPCTAPHMDIWGTRVALLPAGEYDLFAARFPSGVGVFGLYVPAPAECAITRITIDGDTEVAVPDLEPCRLGVLSGNDEEVARRTVPTVEGATGTLTVVVSDYPTDNSEGRVQGAVVPAGTTLGELALGDAWPVGSLCAHLQAWDSLDPDVQRRIRTGGLGLPVLPFPATTSGLPCIDMHQVFDGVAPSPTPLPEGDYDLYVFKEGFSEEEGEGRPLCARTTVTVSGDTTVELPLLEECR